MTKQNNKGFTIIELLISTVVFSVILLVITSAIIQIGRIYYKGVIQGKTQESSRAIIDDVSQSIQFSRSTPTGSQNASGGYICIGNRRYTFVYNTQQIGSQHVLVADTAAGCGGGYAPMGNGNLTTGAKELIGENMQLVNLSVTEVSPGLFSISVHVAYGEDSNLQLPDKHGCQPVFLGGQYCGVSELTTTVTTRLK